jgi:N,N'-diacetyllegionaminate synthase
MIEYAKKSGVNAIKFQTFKAEEFITDKNLTYTYVSQGREITESMLEMFKRFEFNYDDWFKIKKKCDDEKILFLSTPQNYSDLELLLNLDISAIKIGSDDLTNIPLIKKFSSSKLPIILSSGMATLTEISDALIAVGFFSNYPTILLVTTSEYPTPPEDVNLKKFDTLSTKYPNLLLGFSDHTIGPLASSLACAKGSVFFEKHFTLDCNLSGPDHWFSSNPQQLKIWRDSIMTSFQMMGDSIVKPTKQEEKMIDIARRSIVALKDLNQDDVFSHENLGLRRPGTGLKPSELEKIIGKKVSKKIIKGKILQKDDYK